MQLLIFDSWITHLTVEIFYAEVYYEALEFQRSIMNYVLTY